MTEELLSVLLVDDDHDVHSILEEIVVEETLPCHIRHAFNGYQALDLMQQEPPDLLILDIRMPVMDGLALREEMLHDANLVNVQIAVYTGHSMSNTELQVLLADYYLPKPGTIMDLIDVLTRARISMRTVDDRVLKRQEATIQRIDSVIHDLTRLREDIHRKIKKPT